MLALEMDGECSELVNICAQNGLLVNCTHGNILRIMPSIAVTKEEIDEGISVLDKCLGLKQ